MKKWTGEYVTMLKEDGVPVGILYENGHREIYKLKRATKDDVAQFLEVEHNEKVIANAGGSGVSPIRRTGGVGGE